MAFPVVQPVDGPDWSSSAAFSLARFNNNAIMAPGETIIEQVMGYYSYALLTLSGDSDGAVYSVAVQHMGYGPGEDNIIVPVVIYQTILIHSWPIPTVLPMSVYTPILRVVSFDSDNYPHNVTGTLTVMSSPPYTAGFLGGVVVIGASSILQSGQSDNLYPLGVAPGHHSLQVVTDATDFTVVLIQYLVVDGTMNIILCDQDTEDRRNIEWIGSGNAWHLQVTVNDTSDKQVYCVVTREP